MIRPVVNLADVDNVLVFGLVNTFRYTNHEGKTAMRRVIPCSLRYGRSDHYPEDQWLVEAYDLDRKNWRTFALNNIEVR